MQPKLRQLAERNNRLFHTVTALECYRNGFSEQVNAEVIRTNVRIMGGVAAYHRALAEHQDDDGGSLGAYRLGQGEIVLMGLEKG